MEVVFKIKKQNLQKVKDMFLKDDVISKASIVFKEAKGLGFTGDNYYCYVSGVEEACKKAKELIKDLGELAKKEEEKKVIDKIKEEEESAISGFGGIFG